MPSQRDLDDPARQARIQGVNEAAFALALQLEPLDLELAAEHIRQHKPSAEVLASLPFVYAMVARHAAITHALSKPGELSADALLEVTIAATGCRNYAELHKSDHALAKALRERYPKVTLQNAWTKLRRRVGL